MSDPFYRSKPWRTLRTETLRRDRWCCTVCGVDVSRSGAARVDHVRPRSTHPHLALVLSNTRTLCPRCDNQSHREKRRPAHLRTGLRDERFVVTGCDVNGLPLDPNHHWKAR